MGKRLWSRWLRADENKENLATSRDEKLQSDSNFAGFAWKEKFSQFPVSSEKFRIHHESFRARGSLLCFMTIQCVRMAK